MGTSTSHRSPATPEWEAVRELYQRPNPSPGDVVGRIVRALDEATRERLAAPGPVRALDALLQGSAALGGLPVAPLPAAPGTGIAALDLVSQVRGLASAGVAAAHQGAVFGGLAFDALPPTVLGALEPAPAWEELSPAAVSARFGRFAREQDLGALAGLFLGHDLASVFRYLVTRDVADYVGGPGLPTLREATGLADGVSAFCRERATVPTLRPYEQDLQMALGLRAPERAQVLAPLFTRALHAGLGSLAGGAAL